ncbi:HS12B-like protein [Mya arenaria]|uniref:HS12B-like protein n=1 Tax=Mya arenaria TaxID=6604 RepID=A0ABY7EW39_MYAAR|nr:HS12B-like protein [Mya arenaria]
MDLHRTKKLTRTMTIEDEQGRKMPAVEVFAAAIRHLKKHFMEQAENRIKLQENEIRWVITVPAIWNDDAKEFMVEAAKMAGIREDKLSLAYEPEAAAIYCKQIRLAKLREQGKDATIQPFPPGFKFLVLDLGGGTVDITAHEVQRDDTLQALMEPSGGKWGGTLVDDGFLETFEGLFGKEFMTGLKKDIENAESKRELDNEIESKKKTIVGKSNPKADCVISMKLPFAMMAKTKSAQFKSALKGKQIEHKRDKIQIHNSILLTAFETSVSKIVAHLEMLLRKPELKRLDAIVMAGGFSESKVVQEEVKGVLKKYPRIELIIPEDGGLAIVQGISTSVPFDIRIHPVVHRVKSRDGSYRCEDIFKVFVKKGEKVIPGQTTASYEFYPSQSAREHQTIEVYKSEADDPPMLITECQKVGFMRFTMPNSYITGKTVSVQMKFGGTQVKVTADVNGLRGNEPMEASFEWL